MTTEELETGIIVRPEDHELWRRHAQRAHEAGLTCTMRNGEYDPGFPAEQIIVRVSSESDPQTHYVVRVVRWSSPVDGVTILADCSCKAGAAEKPCKHAALALQTANFFPFPTRHEIDPEIVRIGVNLLMGGNTR